MGSSRQHTVVLIRHLPQDYIAIKGKAQVYVPHTAGRWQKRRFRKAQCPITERLVTALMFHGVLSVSTVENKCTHFHIVHRPQQRQEAVGCSHREGRL